MQTAIPVLVKEKREVTVKEERGAIVQKGAIQTKRVAASSRESWALVFECGVSGGHGRRQGTANPELHKL